jgi:SAM-dependent methyltransferase
MDQEPTFFDFAAEVGLTKHLGGVGATEELIELCHIGEGKYVLDVGCGAGVTPCFIAKRYGCRVVGVDISEGLIERSNSRDGEAECCETDSLCGNSSHSYDVYIQRGEIDDKGKECSDETQEAAVRFLPAVTHFERLRGSNTA